MGETMMSVIGARFLILLVHLILVITLFWSLDENAISCLPESFTQDELGKTKTFLTTLYSITIALFFVEFSSFISGCSMFSINQSLISIFAHFGASIALSFFIVNQWSCSTYWFIFWFTKSNIKIMTSLQHNKALIPKIQNKQASSENQISWFFTLILQTYDVLLSTKYEHLFRVIIFKMFFQRLQKLLLWLALYTHELKTTTIFNELILI